MAHRTSSVGAACLLLLASAGMAEEVTIDHAAVGCVVADRFVQIEARLAPAEQVARARVQFRGGSEGPWYFVDMQPVGGVYRGFLPRPKKALKTASYYVEVVDRAFGEHRTPEYAPQVVSSATSCDRRVLVAAAGDVASVVVGGPAGAAVVPLGFSPLGVTSVAGAGVGTAAGSGTGSGTGAGTGAGAVAAGTTAAVAAGAAAAAAGGAGISTALLVVGGVVVAGGAAAAVAAGGGGDKGTPSPAPTPTVYSGALSGQYVVTDDVTAPAGKSSYTCTYGHAYSGTVTVTLEGGGGQVHVDANDATTSVSGPACGGGGPGDSMPFTCTLSGGPGNLACSVVTSGDNNGLSHNASRTFRGAQSGNAVRGTVTFEATGNGSFLDDFGKLYTTAFRASTSADVTLLAR